MVDWKHIALISEGEENDARAVEELGRVANIGHFEAVTVVWLVQRIVEGQLNYNDKNRQYKAAQGQDSQVLEATHIFAETKWTEHAGRGYDGLRRLEERDTFIRITGNIFRDAKRI